MRGNWKSLVFAALAVAGLCSSSSGQFTQLPAADYTPVTSSQLQAVNSDGSSYFATIHPTSSPYPIQYIGVVANNPADMEPLYDTSVSPSNGQFQVFVQALPGGTYGGYTVASGDFSGTALYVGQTVPWNASQNFSDAQWQQELTFLGASSLTTGDVVLVQADAPGLEYNGKYNINVQHWNTINYPGYGFSITVLGQTTPAVAQISLSALVQPDGTQIFDPTMATGCEHYKGSLVHLNDLLLTDPGDWGLGNTVTIQQGNLTFPMQVGLDNGLALLNPQTLATRPFSVTAVVDQESGDYTTGFSVWVTNSANLTMAAPGDANDDGTVDINDLTIVLANYGQTGAAWSQGEFTGDGTVDINDLTIVLAHYGQTAGSSGGPAAVPEPGALVLLSAAVGTAVLAIGRRRTVKGLT